jgi:hypothetical protein
MIYHFYFDRKRKIDAAAGYKFRLQPALKPFFVDLDVQAGYGHFVQL